jgi:hypothetical protein
MKLGDRVRMTPWSKKGARAAIVEGVVDKLDGDGCTGNPERFLTVRADSGELWGFRQPDKEWAGEVWTPKARSLLKIKYAWKCEVLRAEAQERKP